MTTTEPTLRPTDYDDHSPAGRAERATCWCAAPRPHGHHHRSRPAGALRHGSPGRRRRSVHGGTVELTYPMMSVRRRRAADVLTLTGSIPWRIEVDGGVGDHGRPL